MRSQLLLALAFVLPAQQTALTNRDILKMVKAGISEEVALRMIQQNATEFSVTPDDVIGMKAAGVPDTVIGAMKTKTVPKVEGRAADYSKFKFQRGQSV